MGLEIGMSSSQRSLAILLYLSITSVRAEESPYLMDFAYRDNTVYATGIIDADAGMRLKEFVRSNDLSPATVVALSSSGGSVIGGLRLGQAIRELQLHTNVFRYADNATFRSEPADCASACIYAYAGGVQRRLHFDSRLGIHQFYSADPDKPVGTDDTQVLSAAIVAHLSNMGADPTLFSATALFGKDEIRYLSRHEAEDFGLVNNGVTPRIRYRVSKGRPYLALVQEESAGAYELGLLCNGTDIYLGASRDLASHSVFYNEDEEVFLWLDVDPVFKMDPKGDTFYAAMDREMLARLFATRRIRTWIAANGWTGDGTEILVDDWSQFREYASECGRQ